MPSRLQLSVLLIVVAGAWGGLLLLEGVAVKGNWLRPFSTVVGAALVALSVFDLWLWRWRLFHRWITPRPDVRGTWLISLDSNWREQATGQPKGPIRAFLVVRQTFSKLSMRMLTAESSSELVGAAIAKADDGTYQISSVYLNEPKLSVRDRSPIHYGALLLTVEGTPVERLSGHYWTDRDTKGEVRSSDHRDEIYASFDSAIQGFPSDSSSGAPTVPPQVG